MKILRNIGIVVGIHAIALIFILANPGCSSTTPAKARPATVDTAAAAPPPAPATAADPPADSASPPAPAPDASPIVFSPTRPGTAAAAALQTEPEPDVIPATTYVVGRGDSLWSIAKKNHVKLHDIAMANNLKPGTNLYPGQKLIIPSKTPVRAEEPATAPEPESAAAVVAAPAHRAPPSESTRHIVKSGETLGGIARRYNVRVGVIATANNITDPQKIHPGQVLIIPGGKAASSASRPSRAPAAAPAESTPPSPAPAAPPPASDLDSGLKPSDSAAPPVIKVEEAPPAPKS